MEFAFVAGSATNPFAKTSSFAATRTISRNPAKPRSTVRKNTLKCVTAPLSASNPTTGEALPNEVVVQPGLPATRKRRGMMQHKREAYWFYRWLSLVYDKFVNPFHWTIEMREDALSYADLSSPGLKTVDVGGGTGFCTEGIVEFVAAHNVTLMDQSLAQISFARKKEKLNGVKFVEGDAENLPFHTGYADRYVSAGSIEYWPNPQNGISEAYRVLTRGGKACMIGPVQATNPISKFFCNLWMLFPTPEEYMYWFQQAGFQDIKMYKIGPPAYRGIRQHGLIMGLVVVATKPVNGPDLPIVASDPEFFIESSRKAQMTVADRIVFLLRSILGIVAGLYYFLIPFFIIAYAKIFIRKKDKYY